MNRHADVDSPKLAYVGALAGVPVALFGIAGGTGNFGYAWGGLLVVDAAAAACGMGFRRSPRRRRRKVSALLFGFAVTVSVGAALMILAAVVD